MDRLSATESSGVWAAHNKIIVRSESGVEQMREVLRTRYTMINKRYSKKQTVTHNAGQKIRTSERNNDREGKEPDRKN